jgi:hypothetical protein
MPDSNNEEWNFYFGRGGAGNKKRQVSKANILVQDLALRYSYCRQTEKRLFAKKEVYDTVIRKGGAFINVEKNKTHVDVTADADEVITKIMQGFRDINKQCRKSPQLPSTSLKTRKAQSIKRSSASMSISRPKRRCIRPSVIEPPIVEYVREPPKLKNSLSAPIMTDEITAELSRGSQQCTNQNLHIRIQHLENLAAMLMQQKNEMECVKSAAFELIKLRKKRKP